MLYFVGTPIGNLSDMSFRAVETLKEVDEIYCEDTRHSIVLLEHYGIKKPLFSYHKFNEKEASEKIIEKLTSGKNVAVISDAGMPLISDPGYVLVELLIERGIEYTVVPSASAFTSALVLSGMDSSRFCFLGFLPEKTTERKEFLNNYKTFDGTLIFYSAPHDVKKDVESLYSALGNRRAAAVKEITKIHESVIRFNLEDGIFENQKGEFVLIVEGAKKTDEFNELSDEQLIDKFISDGLEKKEALKKVAKLRGIKKSDLYKYTVGK